jgi:hypothetical protein
MIRYQYCTGSTITGAIDVTGGNGGNGGNGVGTGAAGNGAYGGGSGCVWVWRGEQPYTQTTPTTHVANVGQAGGVAVTTQVDL